MSRTIDVYDSFSRALHYPYDPHHENFLFREGKVEPLDLAYNKDGLRPVIAVGSNRAPVQLERKYRDMKVEIPVTRIIARNVDVVFAARYGGYGAVPATLAPSPGTRVELWITWLDEVALKRMDETEALGVGYNRERIRVPMEGDAGWLPEEPEIYTAIGGVVTDAGEPVAFSTIPAEDRRYAHRTTEEMLRRLHDDHGHGEFEGWVRAIAQGEAEESRARAEAHLKARALEVSFEGLG